MAGGWAARSSAHCDAHVGQAAHRQTNEDPARRVARGRHGGQVPQPSNAHHGGAASQRRKACSRVPLRTRRRFSGCGGACVAREEGCTPLRSGCRCVRCGYTLLCPLGDSDLNRPVVAGARWQEDRAGLQVALGTGPLGAVLSAATAPSILSDAIGGAHAWHYQTRSPSTA